MGERGGSLSSSSQNGQHLTAGTVPMLVDTQSVNDRMMLRHRMKLKKASSNKAHAADSGRKRRKKRHSVRHSNDHVAKHRSNSTFHSKKVKEERRRGVIEKYNALAEQRGRRGRSRSSSRGRSESGGRKG